MKKKTDYNNPIIKVAIRALQEESKRAYETPQDVESAVIPIYSIPKVKGHRAPKKKPEQSGSGVLLNIKDQYFILSSTHVFEAFDGFGLITGAGKGSQVEILKGERFSTGKLDQPFSNNLDASVFHIQSPIGDELKELAIHLEDVDYKRDVIKTRPIYLTTGFRVKKSNIIGDQVYSKREAYASIEVSKGDYEFHELDMEKQFAIAYDEYIMVNGLLQKTPILHGFSGGAVIKIEGTDVNPRLRKPDTRQKLIAITTEYRKGENSRSRVLVSTNVGVHLGLIYKFIPGLFE